MTLWSLLLIAAVPLAALGIYWRNRVQVIDSLTLILPLPVDLPPREKPLEGAINFRDVGGYATTDGRRVRRGRVFRSGALHHLSAEDERRLTELGIRWVCDLRSQEEVTEEPDALPDGVAYAHMPLDAVDNRLERLIALFINRRKFITMMPKMYVDTILERNAALYGRVLRHLADPSNLPAIIHCTAGKDRTGVAAALLLLLLGVPEETIVADYSQSNVYHAHFMQYGARAVQSLRRFGIRAEHLQPLLVADPRSIRAALAHIQARYGGIEGYLTRAAGLDSATLVALRAALLE